MEQNGLNAFFVDPAEFDAGFLNAIQGERYRENIVHRRESHSGWRAQFERIQHMRFVEIPGRTDDDRPGQVAAAVAKPEAARR